MKTPNDGGAAFPHPELFKPGYGHPYSPSHAGMSLRDYFAGQALGALGHAWGVGAVATDNAAALAYHLADAMLKEREAQ